MRGLFGVTHGVSWDGWLLQMGEVHTQHAQVGMQLLHVTLAISSPQREHPLFMFGSHGLDRRHAADVGQPHDPAAPKSVGLPGRATRYSRLSSTYRSGRSRCAAGWRHPLARARPSSSGRRAARCSWASSANVGRLMPKLLAQAASELGHRSRGGSVARSAHHSVQRGMVSAFGARLVAQVFVVKHGRPAAAPDPCVGHAAVWRRSS
jgi:hypothetical protein